MLNSAVSVVRTPSSLTSFLLVKMKWINWVGVRLSQFFILFITSCKTNCCPVHVVRVFDQLFWITQHHCPFIKCNSGHSSTVYFMCIFPLYENSSFSMHSCLLWPSPDLALLQKTFFILCTFLHANHSFFAMLYWFYSVMSSVHWSCAQRSQFISQQVDKHIMSGPSLPRKSYNWLWPTLDRFLNHFLFTWQR